MSIKSEYVNWIKEFQKNTKITTLDDLKKILEILEVKKDELEDKLESIPEKLQEGNTGSILQEQIYSLDSVLFDLSYLESEENIKEAIETANDILTSFIKLQLL